MAIPLGVAWSFTSGMCGMPPPTEKRARIGVEGALKWGAIDSVFASSVGVKVPSTRRPLAWAGGG